MIIMHGDSRVAAVGSYEMEMVHRCRCCECVWERVSECGFVCVNRFPFVPNMPDDGVFVYLLGFYVLIHDRKIVLYLYQAQYTSVHVE